MLFTRMRAALLLTASALAPHVYTAFQEPTPAKQDPAAMSDADKEKKVRELLRITNAANMGKDAMAQMTEAFQQTPGLPDGFLDKLLEMAKPEDLVEMVVPIYMKHIAAEDLEPTIAFFQSKVGARWVASQQPILKESMAAGQKWGSELAGKVLQALEEGK